VKGLKTQLITIFIGAALATLIFLITLISLSVFMDITGQTQDYFSTQNQTTTLAGYPIGGFFIGLYILYSVTIGFAFLFTPFNEAYTQSSLGRSPYERSPPSQSLVFDGNLPEWPHYVRIYSRKSAFLPQSDGKNRTLSNSDYMRFTICYINVLDRQDQIRRYIHFGHY